jgi:hypothetical protein
MQLVGRYAIATREAMNTDALSEKFAKMGARIKFVPRPTGWSPPFRLNVMTDRKGEYFEVRMGEEEAVEVEVLDLRPRARHLILMTRRASEKHKFLCGHDERHWFVAAVPERARGVTNVATAMEALKPDEVREAQAGRRIHPRERGKRRTSAFVRQGEWFFVPEPALNVDPRTIRRNEPISRGRGSRPHFVEECYRIGGKTVYVNGRYPEGLTNEEYRRLIDREPNMRKAGWRVLTRDARVYARGAVRHADHRTIRLQGWHRVLMNTEYRAAAMARVAFLD